MKSVKYYQSGFTLIEMLLIMAIIGIISAIGWQVYLRGARQAEVQDVATQLEAAIKQARSNAQTSGANHEVSWVVDGSTVPSIVKSYTVTNVFTLAEKTIVPDQKVIITCLKDCTTPLVYRAPFGEIDAVGPTFQVESAFPGIGKRVIRVYGVTGKVVAEAK